MFEVAIIAKDGRVLRRCELSTERPTTVGRARECDIRLAIATVSRRHAEITPGSGDEFHFRDIGSTHGSFVRGRRVREIHLSDGLEIQIGPARLRFESIASRIGAELNATYNEDSEGYLAGPDAAGSLDDTMI